MSNERENVKMIRFNERASRIYVFYFFFFSLLFAREPANDMYRSLETNCKRRQRSMKFTTFEGFDFEPAARDKHELPRIMLIEHDRNED